MDRFKLTLERLVTHLYANWGYYLLGITIVGLVLRLLALTQREFWYDEAYTGVVMRYNFDHFWATITADVHPPLYYLLLREWTALFGTAEVALRSMSLLFGMALIPATYSLTRRLLASKPKRRYFALLAAVIIAINPFFIAYSVEARVYALMALALTVMTWAWLGMVKAPTKFSRDWIIFAITGVVAAYTHYVAFFMLLALTGFWLLLCLKQSRKPSTLKAFAGAMLIWFVGYLPWLPTFWSQLTGTGNLGWIPQAHLSNIPTSLAIFWYGSDAKALGVQPANEVAGMSGETIGVLMSFLVTALGFWLLGRLWTQKKTLAPVALSLSLWLTPILLVILVSLLGKHFYVERYLIGFGLLFIAFCFVLLSYLKPGKALIVILLYALTLPLIALPTAEMGYRQLPELLASEDRQVVMVDPLQFSTVKYYLGSGAVKLYDEGGVHGYQGWGVVEEQDIVTSKDELGEGYLLLFSSEQQSYSCEQLINSVGQFILCAPN